MEMASPGLFFTVTVFLVVLTVIVFIHEMGHYLAGRLFKVRVEVFSIGFGRELFGWNDKHGTRWKISSLPLGGYVKFFGDAGVASQVDRKLLTLSPEERAVAFHFKPLWQRAIIVAAGPFINIATAILIFAAFLLLYGKPVTPARITSVTAESPAARAGLEKGDLITAVDDRSIERFEDLQRYVVLRPDQRIELVVKRGDAVLHKSLTTERTEQVDRFGNKYEIGRVGIVGKEQEILQVGLLEALPEAVSDTYHLTESMLIAIWDIIIGKRSVKELRGPVGMAEAVGQQATLGLVQLINFIALISINIGLVNLFPIPMLDGGHLAFYAFEALRGKPASIRLQELATMAGLAFVLGLFVFLTWNDLAMIGVWDNLTKLFS